MIKYNISIRTKSPELVEFLYPNYMKLSSFSPFVEGGVIFSGDSKYLQSFRDYNIPYIYVKGTPEYDLTIPNNLFEFVYSKWDKSVPQKVLDYIKGIDTVTSELEELAKLVWVTGKCSIETNEETRMYKLYSLLSGGSVYKIIEEFLTLAGDVDAEKLFYRVQYFLKASTNPSSVSNAKVQAMITKFTEARKKNVEEALMGYLYSPADSVELKMLKLFEIITKANF